MTASLVFESQRLIFHPLTIGDDDIVRQIFLDVDVMRYAGGVIAPDLISKLLPTWTRRCTGGGVGVWVVSDRQTGEKLGTTALLPMPIFAEDTEWDLVQGDGLPSAEIEVGYLFKRAAWGRGFATEACLHVLRFAFENTPLTRIVAVTDADNRASMHVLAKSGLRRVGWRRAYQMDLPAFEIDKAEWLTAHRI